MSPGKSCVLFHVPARGVSRRKLNYFAQQLQEYLVGGASFCCLIASDEELQALNKEFLERDYPTDVLSFPAFGPHGSIGDIAISWDRAKEQAAEYGHTTEREIRILILHGALHLMGLDHEKDQGEMARVEMNWRKRLKLPLGIIERVQS
jgi:probable rRNA maturation factor